MEDYIGLIIMVCFAVLNFVGLGVYHYKYSKQYPEKGYWKDHVEFWLFTILNIFVGISYLGIMGITSLKNWIDSLKK